MLKICFDYTKPVFLLYTYYPVLCGISSNMNSIQIRGELSCFGSVSSSCSTSGTRRATHVLCTIVWHMYCVLYYDSGILYYIMTHVFCTILWHVIVYYIMTRVLCTILWHRYFVIYYETCILVLYYDTGILYYIMTQVFRLYSLLHRYNDYAHYQVCLAHYDIGLTTLSFWDLNFTCNTL